MMSAWPSYIYAPGIIIVGTFDNFTPFGGLGGNECAGMD